MNKNLKFDITIQDKNRALLINGAHIQYVAKQNNELYFIKSINAVNEILISEFLNFVDEFKIYDNSNSSNLTYVKVYPTKINNEKGLYSSTKNFLQENENIISLEHLYERFNIKNQKKFSNIENLNYKLTKLSNIFKKNIVDEFGKICLLQSLIINYDFSERNFLIIYDEDNNVKFAPLIDMGLSINNQTRFSTFWMCELTINDVVEFFVETKNVGLLTIDLDNFLKYKSEINDMQSYQKVRALLINRLEETEGVLWKRKTVH